MPSIPSPQLLRLALAALLVAAGASAPPVAAEPAAGTRGAVVAPTGREIYQRVLDNRFRAYRQAVRLVSGDRGGNEQESRMQLLWKSFRGEAGEGVLSKTVVRYTHPFDLRHTSYLVINQADSGDVQYVYLPTRRRVQRVNLRGEAVLGSDFSFEDVVPRELEDGDYERLADEIVDGVACQVVEVRPRPSAESEYSRFRIWVDAERAAVLRAMYWDRSDVAIKELRSPASGVREFDGVFVAMQSEMRNLKLQSYTHIEVESLEPNPELHPRLFDPSRLETH